ncbi:MAG TPA: hypothetical protein VGA18_01325, partial [Rhodothermales bacterium]
MEPRVLPFAELDSHADPVLLKDGPPTRGESRMTGWLERQGFHPILSAFLLFVVSFVLFQGLATLIAIALVITSEGVPSPEALLDVLEKSTVPLLAGNTVGQFL